MKIVVHAWDIWQEREIKIIWNEIMIYSRNAWIYLSFGYFESGVISSRFQDFQKHNWQKFRELVEFLWYQCILDSRRSILSFNYLD